MLAIWPHRSADTHMQLLHAVLEMHDAVKQFNERLAGNRLMTRFGADWGRVALTTVGAHGHYEYRAVGDAVNTAARIQELNKKLGTSILVSLPAIGDAGSEFLLRDLGRFLLRGRHNRSPLPEQRAGRRRSNLTSMPGLNDRSAKSRRPGGGCCHLQEIHGAFPTDGPTAFFLRRLESGAQSQDGALVVD
jgi:adenylate cyclase